MPSPFAGGRLISRLKNWYCAVGKPTPICPKCGTVDVVQAGKLLVCQLCIFVGTRRKFTAGRTMAEAIQPPLHDRSTPMPEDDNG